MSQPVKLKKLNPRSKHRDEFTQAIIQRCDAGFHGELTPEQVSLVTDAIRSELNERISAAYREIEIGERRTVWSIPNILSILVTTRRLGIHNNAEMPITKLRLSTNYREKLKAVKATSSLQTQTPRPLGAAGSI